MLGASTAGGTTREGGSHDVTVGVLVVGAGGGAGHQAAHQAVASSQGPLTAVRVLSKKGGGGAQKAVEGQRVSKTGERARERERETAW